MPLKKLNDDSYERFSASVKTRDFDCFYIFYGDERYLLDYSVAELRKHLCPGGLDSFNYKRFEGKDIKADDIDSAVNTLPVFAERTLIEIHDFDIFKGKGKSNTQGADDSADNDTTSAANSEKQHLAEIVSSLPEYVCLVFIYSSVPYKPDKRQKTDKEILSYANVVEFALQEQSKLIKWITRHFEACGKRISKADAEYLALVTDGSMSGLVGEIGKISAYADSDSIIRADIDAVVVPVLNAVAYKLTDAILAQNHYTSMSVLDELFQMQEPAHKILFSLSLKMRQLLTARIFIENKLGKKALMDTCDIRYDFQAATLMDTARKITLDRCCRAVILCAEAAYDLNSSAEPEARLTELIARLAYIDEFTNAGGKR